MEAGGVAGTAAEGRTAELTAEWTGTELTLAIEAATAVGGALLAAVVVAAATAAA